MKGKTFTISPKNSTSIEMYSASLSQLLELFLNFVFFYIIYPFFRDYTAGKSRSLRYFPVVRTVPYGMFPAAAGNWPKSPDENPAENFLSRVKMEETREYEDSGGNTRDHERSEGSRVFTIRIRVLTRRLHFYTGNKFLVRVFHFRVTFFKFQIQISNNRDLQLQH